jgi:hypothetical protein
MCPDKKLGWFDDNPDWCPEDWKEVDKIVCLHWEDSYAGLVTNKKVTTPIVTKNQPVCVNLHKYSLLHILTFYTLVFHLGS